MVVCAYSVLNLFTEDTQFLAPLVVIYVMLLTIGIKRESAM